MQKLGRFARVPSTSGVEATQSADGDITGCGIETSLDFPDVYDCHRLLRK